MTATITDISNYNKEIYKIISQIDPSDIEEKKQKNETLEWIASNATLTRYLKPNYPYKHLCAYIIPFDLKVGKILLAHHKKSRLWMPPGGHVEPNELPYQTAKREAQEELNVIPRLLYNEPVFISQTPIPKHLGGDIDVNLWYLARGSNNEDYNFDRREFHDIAWFDIDDRISNATEPHLERFINKVKNLV